MRYNKLSFSRISSLLLLCTARHSSPSITKKKTATKWLFLFGRGRRTWSRLPARSALLLRRGLHRRPAPLGTRFWSSSGGFIFGAYYCYLVLYSLLICLLWTIICQFFIKNIFLVQKFCTNVRKMLEAVLEEWQFLPLFKICRPYHSEKFNFFFYIFCSKNRVH